MDILIKLLIATILFLIYLFTLPHRFKNVSSTKFIFVNLIIGVFVVPSFIWLIGKSIIQIFCINHLMIIVYFLCYILSFFKVFNTIILFISRKLKIFNKKSNFKELSYCYFVLFCTFIIIVILGVMDPTKWLIFSTFLGCVIYLISEKPVLLLKAYYENVNYFDIKLTDNQKEKLIVLKIVILYFSALLCLSEFIGNNGFINSLIKLQMQLIIIHGLIVTFSFEILSILTIFLLKMRFAKNIIKKLLSSISIEYK